MVNFRRNYLKGGCYFFTVTLRDRQSNLLIEHVDLLRNALRETKIIYQYKIIAIVILPDHLHTIWQLPSNDFDFSKRWHMIKAKFTKSVIAKNVYFKKDNRGEYHLWQRRFWEHTIRNEYDLENHINYIHYNPVKHQFVTDPNAWPYSSFHQYVRNGLLPKNWSSENVSFSQNKFGE